MTDVRNEPRNIDELLQSQLVQKIDKSDPKVASEVDNPIENDKSDLESTDKTQDILDSTHEEAEKTADKEENSTDKTDETLKDEYGNDLPKPKMYSEEDVQRMIRERLARVKQQPEPTTNQQQADQKAKSQFEYDPNQSESWEQQLENFIERTVDKLHNKHQQKEQEAREIQIKQEFEHKFYDGMSKIPDFDKVISNQPITDAMMLGIRGIDNPAAFLYAAAKKAPKELERIARIGDPYQQIAEMGRLNQQLRINKPTSNAPKPIKPTQTDHKDEYTNDKYERRNIDHLIHEDARERRRR